MKKSSAGIALAAAVGFSALSATPAMAVTLPFENCDAAAAVNVYNIPVGTPGYHPRLNRDGDNTGCDAAGTPAYDAGIVAGIVAENAPPAPPVAPTPPGPQVDPVPNGGADTGVTQESAGNLGFLALSGGLVLATAAGGTFIVRRRNANQA